MKTRDALVGWMGLKTSDGRPLAELRLEAGARAGVFQILQVTPEEVIVGEDDTHLDFRVCFTRDPVGPCLVVRTDVKFHSWLGRAYFAPVRIGHAMIVKSMLNAAARA